MKIRSLIAKYKILWGREKMAITSVFSPCYNVFKRFFLMVLTLYHAIPTFNDFKKPFENIEEKGEKCW